MFSSHLHGFQIILCVLFIFIFGVPWNTQAVREFWPKEWACDDTKGNYTSNSTFSSNLEFAFSNLTSLSSSRLFSNVTIGSGEDEANKVYALYDCRNDVALDKCHRCIEDAVNSTLDICYDQPKEAVVIYEECMLRYANRMIFSTMELTPNYTNCALVYYINRGIKVAVRSNLESLIDEATMESSSSYFAIKNGIKIAERDYYFLVQCTPDLSRAQCKECLTDALNFTVEPCASDNRLWGQFKGPNCQMRYDVNPFFNVSSSDLISPSPSPPLDDQELEFSGQLVFVSIPNMSSSLFMILMSLLFVI